MVDATPDSAVTVRVGDLAEGRGMILSGKIHGLLMLPLNLQRDVFAGRARRWCSSIIRKP